MLGDVITALMHDLLVQWPVKQELFIFLLNERKNGRSASLQKLAQGQMVNGRDGI